MNSPPETTEQRVTSRFNRVLSVVIWAALGGGCLVVGAAATTRPPLAFALVGLVFLALGTFIVLWRPALIVGRSGVRVINPFRTITIPWEALIHINTQYSLTLHVPSKAFGVWVAPAPGRGSAARAVRSTDAPRRSADARPSDLPGTASGDAAILVRQRWQQLLNDGEIGAGNADTTPVTVVWHVWRIAGCLTGAAASVYALTLTTL